MSQASSLHFSFWAVWYHSGLSLPGCAQAALVTGVTNHSSVICELYRKKSWSASFKSGWKLFLQYSAYGNDACNQTPIMGRWEYLRFCSNICSLWILIDVALQNYNWNRTCYRRMITKSIYVVHISLHLHYNYSNNIFSIVLQVACPFAFILLNDFFFYWNLKMKQYCSRAA